MVCCSAYIVEMYNTLILKVIDPRSGPVQIDQFGGQTKEPSFNSHIGIERENATSEVVMVGDREGSEQLRLQADTQPCSHWPAAMPLNKSTFYRNSVYPINNIYLCYPVIIKLVKEACVFVSFTK